MNALPVRYERITEQDARNEYFQELIDKQFEFAYLILDIFTYDELTNSLRDPLTKFALQAREAGITSCIQISSSTYPADTISLQEAEYDIDNNPKTTLNNCFVASIASEIWKDYLKKVVSILVADIGFDQIIFTEPENRVTLPGTKDRFYEWFKLLNQDMNYPTSVLETNEFIVLQYLRTNTLIRFL